MSDQPTPEVVEQDLRARLADAEKALARVRELADNLHEVAYSQIAREVMLTVLPLGPNRAQVPPHWREEADKRAMPYVAELRAALGRQAVMPAPEAVEAVAATVADLCHDCGGKWTPPCAACEGVVDLTPEDQQRIRGDARFLLMFIRDAIHRDGDDADAVREALGLAVDRGIFHDGRRSPQHARDGRAVRRVVGEWQEAQR